MRPWLSQLQRETRPAATLVCDRYPEQILTGCKLSTNPWGGQFTADRGTVILEVTSGFNRRVIQETKIALCSHTSRDSGQTVGVSG
jgi:hypothetical protein